VARLLLLVLYCVLIAAGSAFAGANTDAKVAVHVLPYDCHRACSRNFPVLEDECDIIATIKDCGDIDFFPVFFDLVEYQGVEYGVEWPGSYSCVFTVCCYTHIGEIVWPGDGTSQCWQSCMAGPIAIPGWGWITVDAPGEVCVVPHPLSGGIIVADCDPRWPQLDQVTTTYCAGVCQADGQHPCKAAGQPIAATTWGSIKHMFR
jgi:hypothetical protein